MARSLKEGYDPDSVIDLAAMLEEHTPAVDESAGRVSSRLRKRKVQGQDGCSVFLLPEAPVTRVIEGVDDCNYLAELTWRPTDGLEAAAFLRQWLSESFLSNTKLPVIMTYAVAEGQWEPWLIACEDIALKNAGYPNEFGLFAARRFSHREIVTTYDGTFIGSGVEGSKAFTRMMQRESAGRSVEYWFQRKGDRQGVVNLYDGASGRDGGAKRANSAWQTRFKDVAMIDDDGDMVVTNKGGIRPLSASMAPEEMHRAAIWVDYGPHYWDDSEQKAIQPVKTQQGSSSSDEVGMSPATAVIASVDAVTTRSTVNLIRRRTSERVAPVILQRSQEGMWHVAVRRQANITELPSATINMESKSTYRQQVLLAMLQQYGLDLQCGATRGVHFRASNGCRSRYLVQTLGAEAVVPDDEETVTLPK